MNLHEHLLNLRRPKSLVSAALHAAALPRHRSLQQALVRAGYTLQTSTQTLVAEEQSLNDRRTLGDTSYPPAKHVMVLAALIRQASLKQTHLSSNLCVAA